MCICCLGVISEEKKSENFDDKRGGSSLRAFQAEDFADLSVELNKCGSCASDAKLAFH